MPTETVIQQRIQKYLKGIGAKSVKQHGNEYSEAGIPDLLVCYRGMFLAMEVKQPGKYPTRLQRVQLQRFKDAGAITGVVRSVEDVEGLVSAIEAQRLHIASEELTALGRADVKIVAP